jgi:hypothetical protein
MLFVGIDNDKNLCSWRSLHAIAFGQKNGIFSDNFVPECFAQTQ